MTRPPTRLPTYVNAITLMTIDLTDVLRPEQATSGLDHLVLAGTGVLAHRVRPDETLSFSLDACAAPAGGGEGVVIDWLEDELAVGGLIAGYDLYKTVRPLLRSLAVPGRHLDLAALAVADKRRFHDLTERVATGVPVSFGQACSRASIAVTPPDQAQRQSWWATGDTPAMLLTLAREAVATWRLWLAQHVAATGDVALGRRAAAEFDVWRTRHPLPTVGPCDRSRSTTARYNEERS